ncbi:MAG: hypothetical protein LBL18_06110, partial [Bacteroidales bacterium]|nr:hypothetical protein [Bacteroidales bacterium]
GWDRAVNLVWNAQRNYLVNYTFSPFYGNNMSTVRQAFSLAVHDLVAEGTLTAADSIEIEKAKIQIFLICNNLIKAFFNNMKLIRFCFF